MQDAGIDFLKVYIVGASLGAQIAGDVASKYKATYGVTFPTATGLGKR